MKHLPETDGEKLKTLDKIMEEVTNMKLPTKISNNRQGTLKDKRIPFYGKVYICKTGG